MGKNAVVLGGGGAKGSYEIGVFEALAKLGFKYDIITGTSVGSINGAVVAQGDISLAKKMWNEINTNSVLDLKSEITVNESDAYKLMAKELMENNGFDYTNLRKLLENIVDEDKLRKSPVDFGLVTVKFPSMIPVHIFKDDMEKGKVIDYILGSAACFPAMKPHKIGNERYIDGGYNDNVPINMAIKKGATNIVAVDLKSVGVIKKVKNKNVDITYINSYSDLGNMLIFDNGRARKNIKLGYQDTMKAFGKADGYKYTFKKGELKKNYTKYYPVVSSFIIRYFKGDLAKYSSLIKNLAYRSCRMRIKGNKKITKEMCLSLILESTMEFLGISVYETYSLRKAEFIIKRKIKEKNNDLINSINELLPEILENKNYADASVRFKEILSNVDNASIVKYIVDLLGCGVEEKRALIMLFLICAPMHFLSAVYIKALTL